MGRLQLGRKFAPAENAKIVALLKTLTGDQPQFLLRLLTPQTRKASPPMPFG